MSAQAPREKQSWNLEDGDEIAQGRFVVERMGGGRRYEAYLAWDEHLLTLTVAKILRPDRVEDPKAAQALRREADFLSRLAHPVLVRGFDAVYDGPYPHLLLEYLDGANLRQLLRRHGPLPLEQLLPVAINVCAALHYLAAEQVVHLDVKPGNIVVGVPPRLIDLGSARTLEAVAQRRKPIGTVAYMAPEQCDPAAFPGGIGPAADIWGLGATLYHALTGEPPFPRSPDLDADAAPTERYPQLVADPPPAPRGGPPALAELVEEMLARDPADRPAAAEVAERLEPIADELSR
ncbi:MAG TPA: serine/threonine-protein kinase [Acidimicrobiia bacterium]|nr:serine/threonine-protein kinase [Acidimicrobiia bacterium]